MGSWLFGKTTTAVNTTPTPASSLRIQTSMQGRPISQIWGTQRIAGNLIWQGSFVAIPQYTTTITSNSGFFGHLFSRAQSTTTLTGYLYQVGIIFGLCYGTITSVLRAWNGTTATTAAAIGFVTFQGTDTQTAWSFPPTAEQLNYRGIAYVANPSLQLGSSPSLPSLNFEVEAVFVGEGPTGQDADPSDVVTDILTNFFYGIQFPTVRLGDLTQYSNYCIATGMVGSPIITEQTSAQTFLADLMEATNSTLRWSNGQLTAIPWGTASITANGVTFTPDITPVYDLDEDDFLSNENSSLGTGGGGATEPITFVRTRKSDKLNIVKIEYLDRASDYDPVALDAKDEASINAFGERPTSLYERHLFTNGDAAQTSAYLQLLREQIDGLYSFTLPAKFILLDVEDIVTLTRPQMGLNQKPVRIIEIQENDDYSLTFTAEEYLGTTSGTYGLEPNAGNSVDLLADPGPVSAHLIFHPPDGLAAPATDQIAVWLAAAGPLPFADMYGGAIVWLSTDGSSYVNIGNVTPGNFGFINAALPNVADPDATSTLKVDLLQSHGVLPDGNSTNYALGLPACWLDGEVVAYLNNVLTTAYNYNLTSLRRGQYGTAAAAHSVGAPFCLIDPNVFKTTVPSALSGATIYFKFQPYNIYLSGSPDLSTILPVPYVVGSSPSAAIPYPTQPVNDQGIGPPQTQGDNFVQPDDTVNLIN